MFFLFTTYSILYNLVCHHQSILLWKLKKNHQWKLIFSHFCGKMWHFWDATKKFFMPNLQFMTFKCTIWSRLFYSLQKSTNIFGKVTVFCNAASSSYTQCNCECCEWALSFKVFWERLGIGQFICTFSDISSSVGQEKERMCMMDVIDGSNSKLRNEYCVKKKLRIKYCEFSF